jgi:hypothetical protein
MRSLVTTANLTNYWNPGEAWGHTTALAPLFAVHAARRVSRTAGEQAGGLFVWEWQNARATRRCLESVWNMTGEWQARRAVSMDRDEFNAAVLKVVPRVARVLNRHEVGCAHDLASLTDGKYRTVAMALHEAVAEISEVRHTVQIEPVLGSKVLHHYFPSVVPVFDTALIRRRVLCLPAFREFLRDDEDGWLVYATPENAIGHGMLEFHRYFAFCAAQIQATSLTTLAAVRKQFGNGFSGLAPMAFVDDCKSLLWMLDAKIAEYCLLGEAERGVKTEGRGHSRW